MLIVWLVVNLAPGAAAVAGLLDSPPPTFASGETGKVVYRMGPIYFALGRADTLVTCTNLAGHAIDLAFEIYDERDQLSGNPALERLATGGARTFATSPVAGLPGARVVSGLSGTIDGKARISATSAQLSCVGIHRIRGDDGTAVEVPLTLIKKVTR